MGQFQPVVNCNTNGRAPASLTGNKAFPTSAAAESFTMDAEEAVAEVMPKSSAEQQAYKNDPFMIRNGQYVGHDGFVVPKDFKEFYTRFPDHVGKWVNRHADRSATKEDMEDWTNDLLVHLMRLPENSKYRQAGKSDLVQTFDPAMRGGANQARFWDYIHLCLTNKFSNMRSKRLKDALCQPGNLSLVGQTEDEDSGSVGDEYCHSNSEFLREAAKAGGKQADDRARLQEFENFVRREDAKVLPVIEALLATGTQGEAADWLGITESEFGRTRNRLSKLGRCYLSGESVPKAAKNV